MSDQARALRLRRHRLVGGFHTWAAMKDAAAERRETNAALKESARSLFANSPRHREEQVEVLEEWRAYAKWKREARSQCEADEGGVQAPPLCLVVGGEALPELANIPDACTAAQAKLPAVTATLRRMRSEALTWFQGLPGDTRREMCTIVCSPWVHRVLALRTHHTTHGPGAFLLPIHTISAASAAPSEPLAGVAFRPWPAHPSPRDCAFRQASKTLLRGLEVSSSIAGEPFDTLTLTPELAADGAALIAAADTVSLGHFLCMADKSAQGSDAWWLTHIVRHQAGLLALSTIVVARLEAVVARYWGATHRGPSPTTLVPTAPWLRREQMRHASGWLHTQLTAPRDAKRILARALSLTSGRGVRHTKEWVIVTALLANAAHRMAWHHSQGDTADAVIFTQLGVAASGSCEQAVRSAIQSSIEVAHEANMTQHTRKGETSIRRATAQAKLYSFFTQFILHRVAQRTALLQAGAWEDAFAMWLTKPERGKGEPEEGKEEEEEAEAAGPAEAEADLSISTTPSPVLRASPLPSPLLRCTPLSRRGSMDSTASNSTTLTNFSLGSDATSVSSSTLQGGTKPHKGGHGRRYSEHKELNKLLRKQLFTLVVVYARWELHSTLRDWRTAVERGAAKEEERERARAAVLAGDAKAQEAAAAREMELAMRREMIHAGYSPLPRTAPHPKSPRSPKREGWVPAWQKRHAGLKPNEGKGGKGGDGAARAPPHSWVDGAQAQQQAERPSPSPASPAWPPSQRKGKATTWAAIASDKPGPSEAPHLQGGKLEGASLLMGDGEGRAMVEDLYECDHKLHRVPSGKLESFGDRWGEAPAQRLAEAYSMYTALMGKLRKGGEGSQGEAIRVDGKGEKRRGLVDRQAGPKECTPSGFVLEKYEADELFCSVCQERIGCGEIGASLPCSHIFHEECIRKWLLQTHSCPTCRHDIRIKVGTTHVAPMGPTGSEEGAKGGGAVARKNINQTPAWMKKHSASTPHGGAKGLTGLKREWRSGSSGLEMTMTREREKAFFRQHLDATKLIQGALRGHHARRGAHAAEQVLTVLPRARKNIQDTPAWVKHHPSRPMQAKPVKQLAGAAKEYKSAIAWERARHAEECAMAAVEAAVVVQGGVRGFEARREMRRISSAGLGEEEGEAEEVPGKPLRTYPHNSTRAGLKRNRNFVWSCILFFARKVAQQAFRHWHWVSGHREYSRLAGLTFGALLSEFKLRKASKEQAKKAAEEQARKAREAEQQHQQQAQTAGPVVRQSPPLQPQRGPMPVPPAPQALSLLHYEISCLVQTATDAALRDVALVAWATAAVQQAAMKLWPAAEAFVYGSRSTGLSLPQSDLDIFIAMPTPASGPAMMSREAAKEYIRMLYNGLTVQIREAPWAQNVEALTSAAVPVIHVLAQKPSSQKPLGGEGAGQLLLDISIVQGHHQGEKGVGLIQSLLQALPTLRPLFLAIKTLLLSHGLCCSYTGGLSSYGLVLLVTYFLQDPRNPANIAGQACPDFGVAYLQLLDFVGNQFDPSQEIIMLRGELLKTLAVDQAGSCKARDKEIQGEWLGGGGAALRIQDPNDACNNPGRNATSFPHIQDVCRCELRRQIQVIQGSLQQGDQAHRGWQGPHGGLTGVEQAVLTAGPVTGPAGPLPGRTS